MAIIFGKDGNEVLAAYNIARDIRDAAGKLPGGARIKADAERILRILQQ